MGRGRSGEEFSARPVKHVLSVLSSLQTCRNGADCTCPSWHPEPDQTHDAVLDVFRRQFFNDPGRPVTWDKASHFAVFFRYVKCLQTHPLRQWSARSFVEPKTEDAPQPHEDFQVVWLPQLDFSPVAHSGVFGSGQARQEIGIRVHVKHVERVFTTTKPDAVHLAPEAARLSTVDHG